MEVFVKRLVLWILRSGVPLRIVDNPEFKEMIGAASSTCKAAMGGRTWLTNQLQSVDGQMTAMLQAEFRSASAFSISLDGWDWHNKGVELLSVHFHFHAAGGATMSRMVALEAVPGKTSTGRAGQASIPIKGWCTALRGPH